MSEPSVKCPDCKNDIPISQLQTHYAAHKSGTLSTPQATATPQKAEHKELFSEKLLNHPVWGPVLRRYWFHLILVAYALGWLFGARII